MSTDINALGSLLHQLQQGSQVSGGGLFSVRGTAQTGQKLPLTVPPFDGDPDDQAGSTTAAPVTGQQLPSQQFSANVLAQLLASQTQTPPAPPSTSDVAKQLISNLDANGDGTLSLSEVEKALGVSSTSSSSTAASSTSCRTCRMPRSGRSSCGRPLASA